MISLPSHLLSRTLVPLPIFAIGFYEVVQGVSNHLVGRTLCGIAIALMAVNAYLQPLIFMRPLGELLDASRAAALGPAKVRIALTSVSIGCLLLGMFAKYVLKT